MSNHSITFTALYTPEELEATKATFARKIAFAQSVFSTLAEANAFDCQPFVSTFHSELESVVRRSVYDALLFAAPHSVGDQRQSLTDSIVEHAFDSGVATAARYVIENVFSSALATYQEACDGRREGWYTPNEYAAALVAYNDAFDLLNRTVGPKAGA